MSDSLNDFFNKIGSSKSKGNISSSGKTRDPFLPQEHKLSSVYVVDNTSFKKTNNGHPVQLTEETKIRKRIQQGGFTPLNYTRTSSGEFIIDTPDNLITTEESLSDNISSYESYGDENQSDFRFSLKDFVKFNAQKNQFETSDGGNNVNSWEKSVDKNPLRLSEYDGTPYDNEDPVYFGFEIIINVQNSPLLNGELDKFIDQIGGDYEEISSRKIILNQFKNELFRYFKFSTELTSENLSDDLIIATDLYGNKKSNPTLKRYYVKKVNGLDKLIESNTMSDKKSFVDYGKDKLIISFFEDTTLNLGTLASLYKLLYWSKLRGKSLLPENLLRFDCEIIVSELRDFVRLKKSGNMLEVLKANLSRYRYQIFECQFWFNKMTHGESVDMSSSPLERTDNYDIEITFKYSNMIFERYDPSSLMMKRMRNGTIDPLAVPGNGEYINRTINDNEQKDIILKSHETLSDFPIEENKSNFTSPVKDNAIKSETIDDLKKNEKELTNSNIKKPNPSNANSSKNQDIYGKATDKLLEGIKKAALNEGQKLLNDQFRLLNNSLDKVRNSFGIGKMREPTNVYKNVKGGQFFFDVKNSLRGFAGDTLTGLISKEL